jgi:hypothetical protein
LFREDLTLKEYLRNAGSLFLRILIGLKRMANVGEGKENGKC